MDQYGPSFEEVMSFHSNIAMPLQPHFVISFARRLSNKFERSIQIGLPTGVGLSLQYGNNNSRYMGAFSADGSVQGEYSHFFSKHLRGSIMGMVSPAPDSLKVIYLYFVSFGLGFCLIYILDDDRQMFL